MQNLLLWIALGDVPYYIGIVMQVRDGEQPKDIWNTPGFWSGMVICALTGPLIFVVFVIVRQWKRRRDQQNRSNAMAREYAARVLVEKRDLDEKIAKLDAFIGSPAFKALDDVSRDLLTQQRATMNDYSFILGQRIVHFG